MSYLFFSILHIIIILLLFAVGVSSVSGWRIVTRLCFSFGFYLPAVVLPGNHREITILFYKTTTKKKLYRFVAYKLRPRGRLRTHPMRKKNNKYIMCGITGILCTTIRYNTYNTTTAAAMGDFLQNYIYVFIIPESPANRYSI